MTAAPTTTPLDLLTEVFIHWANIAVPQTK
jgi:hypothetical protein